MAVIVQTSTFRFSSLSITASPLGLVRSPFFRVRVFALAIKRRRLSSVTLVPEELFFSHTLQLITCGLFSLGFCGFPLPVLSVFYTECIVALFRALFCFFFFSILVPWMGLQCVEFCHCCHIYALILPIGGFWNCVGEMENLWGGL